MFIISIKNNTKTKNVTGQKYTDSSIPGNEQNYANECIFESRQDICTDEK